VLLDVHVAVLAGEPRLDALEGSRQRIPEGTADRLLDQLRASPDGGGEHFPDQLVTK
jgi:hypothetical protein